MLEFLNIIETLHGLKTELYQATTIKIDDYDLTDREFEKLKNLENKAYEEFNSLINKIQLMENIGNL